LISRIFRGSGVRVLLLREMGMRKQMMEVKIRRIVVVEVVVRVMIIRYNKIIDQISRIMQNNLFLIEQMENFKCL
jgi:hypothetical protein